ncbi:WhiB family transcriptional regulator [Rhodococcus oryzae]|uniref:WhiB family transcriptional regulator n=1 Tax=Rhodococcus oryzae TaxID=2571143 RepID=UPI0037222B8D
MIRFVTRLSNSARLTPGIDFPGDFDLPRPAELCTWVDYALCRGEPDQMFVRGAAQREAAALCRRCPVILQCGIEALDNGIEYGVWGGMTERKRRALLKLHPNVESWADLVDFV